MSFGKAKQANIPQTQTISTPGFTVSSSLSGSTITPKNTLPQQEFGSRFPRILQDLDTLRGQVDPVSGAFRSSIINRVRDQRSLALGDLRQSLARRRLAGSSFETQQIAAAEADFARALGEAEAQAGLQAFDLFTRVNQQETAILSDALNRELALLGSAGSIGQSATECLDS